MRSKKGEHGSLPGAVISATAFIFFMYKSLDGLIFLAIPAVLSVVVFAKSASPFLANYIGKKSGNLFIGGERHDIIPLLSEAKSTANSGDYEGAASKYRKVLINFPDELKIYHELFLLYKRLERPDKSREVYKIGYKTLTGEKRERLIRMFREEGR